MSRSMRYLVATVVLLVVTVPSALAWNGGADRVLFGEDLVLLGEEVVTGDVLVFGGDVHLHQNSLVEGDLLLMGGVLRAAGEVAGDIVLLGGSADLEASVAIGGDVLALGGSVVKADGASVGGAISEGFPFRFYPRIQQVRLPSNWWSNPNPAATLRSWAGRGVRSVISSLVLAFVAVMIMAIWPKQTQLVSRTLWRSPGASVGAGVISVLIAVAVIVALVITICLSPVAALALAAAWLFGWCALGLLIGQRLRRALKVRDLAPLWQAAAGVFLLSMAGSLPCVGWMIWVFGGMYALGAVVLTRLGTRPYDGSSLVKSGSGATAGESVAAECDDVMVAAADHFSSPDLASQVGPVRPAQNADLGSNPSEAEDDSDPAPGSSS